MANLIQKIGIGVHRVGDMLAAAKSAPTSVPLTGVTSEQIFSLIGSYNPFNSNTSYSEYYKKCPQLASIIGIKNSAFTNGDVEIFSTETNEPVKGMSSWYEIIENPNPLQTQTEFESQLNTYLTLYGYAVEMKTRGAGLGSLKDSANVPSFTARWVLPIECLDIEWNNVPFYKTTRSNRINKIYFNFNGTKQLLNKDDIYIHTALNATLSSNPNMPGSPLAGMERPIQNIIYSYESASSVISNGGPTGILSNKGVKMGAGHAKIDEGRVKELQSDYKRKYGTIGDKWKMLITEMNLEYQALSSPLKDLMLNEEIESRTMDLMDRLGVPKTMIGYSNDRTYENGAQDERKMYTGTIIPEAKHYYQQDSKSLFGELPFKVVADFSNVDAMQDDELQKARAAKDWAKAYSDLWNNDLVTRNEYLEKNDEQPIGPEGDVYKTQWLQTVSENNPSNEE